MFFLFHLFVPKPETLLFKTPVPLLICIVPLLPTLHLLFSFKIFYSSFINFLYFCFSLTKKLIICFCGCALVPLINLWRVSELQRWLSAPNVFFHSSLCLFLLLVLVDVVLLPKFIISLQCISHCIFIFLCYLDLWYWRYLWLTLLPPDACQILNCLLLKAPLSSLLPRR